MTIVQAIKSLAEYLQVKLTEDRNYLQYKSSTDPNEFETAIPSIYCFTMPSSTIIDSYPAKCPAICITLDGRDDDSYSITLHLCISNVSLSEKEMAVPVQNEQNCYTVGEGEECTTEADEDLLIESILFTDQMATYMYNYTAMNVSEISIDYTDVSLPDFPYAVSSVSFKMSVNVDNIGRNPLDDMY